MLRLGARGFSLAGRALQAPLAESAPFAQLLLRPLSEKGLPTKVVEISTDRGYNDAVTKAADEGKLAVIDFTAKWCGPCKIMAPIFDSLSAQHPHVQFLRVDIDGDEIAETVTKHLITQVPTFKFVRNLETIESFSGADKRRLEDSVSRLAKE